MNPKDGTVAALIEVLKTFPPDARVEIIDYEADPYGGFGYPDMGDSVADVEWYDYATGIMQPVPTNNHVVGLFSR